MSLEDSFGSPFEHSQPQAIFKEFIVICVYNDAGCLQITRFALLLDLQLLPPETASEQNGITGSGLLQDHWIQFTTKPIVYQAEPVLNRYGLRTLFILIFELCATLGLAKRVDGILCGSHGSILRQRS